MQRQKSNIKTDHRPRRQAGTRAGFMYMLVLGLTLVVFIMAMAAVTVARNEIQMVAGISDWDEARQLALSAIENGIARINDDRDWRDHYQHAAPNPSAAGATLGHGSFVWSLNDPDGDLNDSATDPVRIHGIGRVGDTVYAASVLVRPTGSALSCLQTSLHSSSRLSLDFSTLNSNQTVSSNSDVSAQNASTANAKVQATGTVSGATYNGVTISGYPPRQMPDSESAFEYYLVNGRHIAVTSLPAVAGQRLLQQVVLSPATNPFGQVSQDGVYVIDCQSQPLIIRNSRIVGTLVILNPGPGSRIDRSVTLEPAIDWFPTLMVNGDFEISFTNSALAENNFAVNFNPPGTPFPYLNGNGSNSDTTLGDNYPSRITGLVYVAGKLRVLSNAPTVYGCVVVDGQCELQNAQLRLRYRRTWQNYPPPGFTVGDVMEISPGTWRREAL